MNQPLVSVVIPTYNRAHLISDAIQSIVDQSFENWELIIVDDASTDNTFEVISQFKHEKIKYIKRNINRGNAFARNIGVKAANGIYISFLDSDDQMQPESLKKFSELIENKPATNFAFGGYYVLNTETKEKVQVLWKPDPSKSFLKDLKIGTGCGLFVKSDCFNSVGYFDERLRVAVDTDWLIRLEKQYSYEVIEDYLITVFTHPGDRVRNNKNELLKSYKIIFQKNKKEISLDKKLLFKYLYKLQFLNYQCNKNKDGNNFFKSQIKNGIFNTKAFLSFILYNLLPLKQAISLHQRISGIRD